MKRTSARMAGAAAAKKAKLAEAELLAGTGKWQNIGEESKGIPQLLYRKDTETKASERVAAFDIDWTIIATKSGRQFPTGPSDWKFLLDEVPDKLRKLHEEGTRVVFFTNQGGIEKGRTTVSGFQGKVDSIISELGIPVEVFVATGESHYRKPSPEMWHYMAKHCNGGTDIDLQSSIYVGDAAGRKKGWRKDAKKDFSCSDRMFAINIGLPNVGLPFKTPEEYFLGMDVVAFDFGDAVDPYTLIRISKEEEQQPLAVETPSSEAEMVVLVGLPASGKSTFAKKHFVSNGYVHVNRDTLQTKEKCLKVASEALENNKCVVIDNTNPSVEARAEFVQLAKRAGVPVRCFHVETSNALAHHLNYYRQNVSKGALRRVPDVAYRMFQSKFVAPTIGEGFESVTQVPFVPEFSCDADREAFELWT